MIDRAASRLERELRAYVEEPMKRWALRAALLRPYRSLRFHSFGAKSMVHRPECVYGPQQISIGNGVIVQGHAWLSVERPAWSTPAPAIAIGDRVIIRPYCTISAAESILIEDDVVLSAFSSVIDSDHTFGGSSDNVVWNGLDVEPIRIGRGTWIGERVAVLKGAQIGAHCAIGANSVVRGEIPDHAVAVGAPARVVGSTGGEGDLAGVFADELTERR